MRRPAVCLSTLVLFAVGVGAGSPVVGAAGQTGNASAPTSASAISDDRLRQFMAQVRPQPMASQAGGSAVRAAMAVSSERLQDRAELLRNGEAALSRMQVGAALQAFERAALILHAADTEIALVRSYMQGGEYRRALAFGAHTAGAHLDVVGGSALYAWLLHVGGQRVIAQRLLSETQVRIPGNTLMTGVQQQLQTGAPLATGELLTLPIRLAPYGASQGVPHSARVVGSGLLLHSGKHALVPLSLLPNAGPVWLRNGLGQLAKARIEKRLSTAGLAVLRLNTALPAPDELWVADKDAFPGSVGFAVEYVVAPSPAREAAPAWPVLHTGFVGGMASRDGTLDNERLLGIEMPAGPRGGPVFDNAGRLVGLALPGKRGAADRLVLASLLRHEMRKALGAGWDLALGLAPPPGSETRASVDKIYETSLRTSLQLITAP